MYMASMDTVVAGWSLLQLPGCNARERFKRWQDDGGALSGDKSIGCGLNALTFLGIFSRAEGEALLAQLKGRDDSRGTLFGEMMKFVFDKCVTNKKKQECGKISQYAYDITTLDRIQLFEHDMKVRLLPGCCTVIKLVRFLESKQSNGMMGLTGHSVVLSNEGGRILLVDPQQGKVKDHDSVKALNVWGSVGYQFVYVMGTDTPTSPGHVTHRKINEELKSGTPFFHPMNMDRAAEASMALSRPLMSSQHPLFTGITETPTTRNGRLERERLFMSGQSVLPHSSRGSRSRGGTRRRKRNRKTRHFRSS